MEDNKIEIFALIDELQEELEMSPNAMLSKKKVVDPEIVMEIIADMRAALPQEIEKGKKVLHEREQMVESAKEQAQEIIDAAKEQAEDLVNMNQVTDLAYEKASKIIETAKVQADEIRKAANVYADEVLSELEQYFTEYVELIRENKNRINNKIEKVDVD